MKTIIWDHVTNLNIFGMSNVDTRKNICVKNLVMLCIDVHLHCLLQNQIEINKNLFILTVYPTTHERYFLKPWKPYTACTGNKGAQ